MGRGKTGLKEGGLSSAGPGSPSATGPSQGLTQMGRRPLILLQGSVSPPPPPQMLLAAPFSPQ